MNIYDLQSSDYRLFLGFTDILKSAVNTDLVVNIDLILKKLKYDLIGHNLAEEEIFFTSLKVRSHELAQVTDAVVADHRKIEKLLIELESNHFDIKTWLANLNQLETILKDDMHQEEDVLLPAAKKIFSAQEAEELGLRMILRKTELEKTLVNRLGKKVQLFAESML